MNKTYDLTLTEQEVYAIITLATSRLATMPDDPEFNAARDIYNGLINKATKAVGM